MSVYSTETRIEIKGIPFQGHGFFKDYYTLFRGRGYTLSNSDRTMVGLYNSLVSFFTANFILAYNCSDNAKEINELVKYPLSKVVHIVTPDETKQAAAYASITSSLSNSDKILHSFSLHKDVTEIPDRDMLKHDVTFYRIVSSFPNNKASSALVLKEHLDNILEISQRTMIGGFLLIIIPKDSENIDLLLSSIEVVAGSSQAMTYNGVVFFDPLKLPVWIFRKEPLNQGTLAARTNMARKRLRKYLKVFEDVVENLSSDIINTLSLAEQLTKQVLKTKVTPSHELFRLFEILQQNFPREIINATLPYQTKYNNILNQASITTSKSSLLPLLNYILYDFAVSIARKIQIEKLTATDDSKDERLSHNIEVP